jgi:hypothetical protein
LRPNDSGRNEIALPHASVQPLKHLRILGWRDVADRYGLVVSPQCDDEAGEKDRVVTPDP